ncbi:membrane protein DedA with SNARE-associated domain [Conyzicola lurida]|uniref:Membrane protein DedA with SNARE-associated domain n=1 Tax=Conyzicola lurida TaxID=1172621 RepID=A0A841APQ3_9MICO|nr:DedA family protein [Conyzicola lurida]MBB5843741.1 membrane protein DedA with SNARE-associated domain [Conyzicola lurida]
MAIANSDGSALTGFADWAVSVMETLGAPGAGLVIAIENLFPPLPSEVILPLAGFTASRGSFSLIEAIAFTTIGSVVGALVLYALGAWLGRGPIRALVGKLPLMDVEDFDRTEVWFNRHGTKAVFFGRMVPLFRSFISLPAGVERMPVLKFTALTAAGSLIWNSIFVVAGFYLGENWHIVEEYAGIFQKVVIAVVIALVVWFLTTRIRSIRRKRSEAVEAD